MVNIEINCTQNEKRLWRKRKLAFAAVGECCSYKVMAVVQGTE
jgi:hypothetical protein